MARLSEEEANQLAALLNDICGATLEALQPTHAAQRPAVAAALRDFRRQFTEESEVGSFVDVLAAWVDGHYPTDATLRALNPPFDGALASMMGSAPPPATDEERPPISGPVLAQLLSTIVAAHAAGDEGAQRQLAAQLVNIRSKLPPAWQERLGPLLDNLRSVLGGADPHTLPPVPDPHYQNLWAHTALLLTSADLSEEAAPGQLLERLVHNARFTRQANEPALTEGFLRALLDVQRQALATEAPAIATLVAAIRALLQGQDPAPFVAQLSGEERAAWQRIIAADRNEGAG